MVVSEVCVVSEVLCLVSDEEKGRHTLSTHVSHRRKRETRQRNAHLAS
jgi:hypothetical protein